MDFKLFTFSVFVKVFLISCMTLSSVPRVESAKKKCSRIFNKIPVHKDFNLKKFAGTWYTKTRTTFAWKKNTFESFSMEIVENEDGSFQISYTGQINDKCLPVETGILETKKTRPGQYVLNVSGQKKDHPTLIVSFTDYKNLALVYFCFKYRTQSKQQCRQNSMQIEILSRDQDPDEQELAGYIKRAGKRLCVKANQLIATKPGRCLIPDILAAAKQKEIDLKEEDSKSRKGDLCAVNNIPVQKQFNTSQLHGLWYEIARTRSTANDMESVLNFHRYDEPTHQIYSYYIGTRMLPAGNQTQDGDDVQDNDDNVQHEAQTDDGTQNDNNGDDAQDDSQQDDDKDELVATCMSPILGMSKTAVDGGYDSDRLGRLGWENSTFWWLPMKVLYADDDYLLLYACYSGATDERCNEVEVTLSGRTREISPEKREEIYSILPEICIDASQMVTTEYLKDCSDWINIPNEEVEPEDCLLDDIQVYDGYILSQLEGTWYLYSSISYNNMTSLNGVVMEKTLSYIEGIETRMLAFSPEDNTRGCTQYFSRSRDMCTDSADHIVTLPEGDGNYVFSKVLFLDKEILVEYNCLMRTVDGTCDRNGIQFNVYTTNQTAASSLANETINQISELAASVCLDPADMQFQTEWCNITELQHDSDDIVECDLDRIELFGDMGGYVQEQMYGYWYEVARSVVPGSETPMTYRIAFFTSSSNETLHIFYTERANDTVDSEGNPFCSEVLHGSMITRCRTDIMGDFLYRFTEAENFTSYVPFKVLETDYTDMLVTYMCTEVLPSGECSEAGTDISVWSRKPFLDENSRLAAEDTIFWQCPDPDMTYNTINNSACRQSLEEYIVENQLDNVAEDESEESENDESDENNDTDGYNEAGPVDNERQNDQSDRSDTKYELSDIDEFLFMDDDEFYYGL